MKILFLSRENTLYNSYPHNIDKNGLVRDLMDRNELLKEEP